MMRTARSLAALVALFLVLGAVPALADEGDAEVSVATETEEEGAHLNGKFLILFAEGFDATEEDLTTLAEMGFGWGDLFKLNIYSSVLGRSIEDLIEGATFDEETGEYDFAWGELKQSLTDEQLALLEGMPRNFGQFVSQDKRHQGRDEHQPDHAGADGEQPTSSNAPDKSDNPNKPDHAGRGGRSGK